MPVDATKFESSDESKSIIVEEEDVDEEEIFGEVVAATDLDDGFLEARIFLTLFAYS